MDPKICYEVNLHEPKPSKTWNKFHWYYAQALLGIPCIISTAQGQCLRLLQHSVLLFSDMINSLTFF